MEFLFGVNFTVTLLMTLGFAYRKQQINSADMLIVTCMAFASCQFALLAISHASNILPLWLKLYAGGSGFLLLQALLFAYIIKLVGTSKIFSLCGFLPFFAHYLVLIINSIQTPDKYSFIYGITLFTIAENWERWLGSLILLSAVSFPILGLYLISVFQVRIKERYSEVYDIDLRWLKNLLSGSLIVLMIGAILVAPFIDYLNLDDKTIFFALFGSVSVYNLYLGIHSLNQAKTPNVNTVSQSSIDDKFLNPDELVSAKEELTSFMIKHKPFTQRRLTLDELADHLYWPAFKLTEVINKGFTKNFYEFINFYRIELVKETLKLDDTSKQNLLDVALASGFNSKTSFNTVFKRFEGMTPTEFRKVNS